MTTFLTGQLPLVQGVTYWNIQRGLSMPKIETKKMSKDSNPFRFKLPSLNLFETEKNYHVKKKPWRLTEFLPCLVIFVKSGRENKKWTLWNLKIHFAIVFIVLTKLWDYYSGFDYSVDNESLETLYWLKWGFVIEITGYVYSRKCKKNAKLNWIIKFQILVTFFSKCKQKNASRVSRAQNILTISFWHFHYTFDYNYSQWS